MYTAQGRDNDRSVVACRVSRVASLSHVYVSSHD